MNTSIASYCSFPYFSHVEPGQIPLMEPHRKSISTQGPVVVEYAKLKYEYVYLTFSKMRVDLAAHAGICNTLKVHFSVHE